MRGGGRLSLAFLPVVVAMMVSGPAGAAVVTLFGVPIFYLERGQQGFRRVLFNAAQMFLAAGLAGWVYSHIGGIVIDAAMKDTGKAVIPWILAVLLFFVLNTVLVTFVLTPEGERLVRYWNRRQVLRLPALRRDRIPGGGCLCQIGIPRHGASVRASGCREGHVHEVRHNAQCM
jgi:hypothetical protein